MQAFLIFLLLGLSTGSLYAISALGLVLNYRTSGVVNFASGGIGMMSAYCFSELQSHHVAAFEAVLGSLVLGAVLGAVTWLVTIFPLRNSGILVKTIATLAFLVVLQSIAALRYSTTVYVINTPLPSSPFEIFGVRVGEDRLILLVGCVVLAIALGVIYRRTKFGLATSAVADNEQALATLGYSTNLIAITNWTLAGAISGLAGVLLAPITGLTLASSTALLLPTLAAAVVGNFQSFPVTLAAGLGIGAVQGILIQYVGISGLGDAVPFVVALAIVFARGRWVPSRGDASATLPAVTAGRVNVPAMLTAGAVVLALVLWVLPVLWVQAITVTVTGSLVLLSFVVVTGYAGQISLIQWTLAGVGALVMARCASAGIPILAAIAIGAIAGFLAGLLAGLPALRARGVQLAIATLALSTVVVELVLQSSSITGSAAGISIGLFQVDGYSLSSIIQPRRYAFLVIVVFMVLAVGLLHLRRGRAGRRLLAARRNERAAASLGVNVAQGKLIAFALGGLIATFGGMLTILRFPSALFTDFDPSTSISLLSNAIIGGVGYVTGPLVGGTGTPGGLVNQIFQSADGNIVLLVMAVLTLVVIIQAPDGVWILNVEMARTALAKLGLLRRVPASAGLSEAERGSIENFVVKQATLVAENVSVTFGTVRALDSISLELKPGRVLGVIGPNGAGKTTLIDAITGFVLCKGAIRLSGEDISRAPVYRRARLGVGRSFQSLELVEDMSVRENLLVASEPRDLRAWFTTLFWPSKARLSSAAAYAITVLGLEGVLDKRPGDLAFGQRRLVAIARSIAVAPSVLLLDEPASGLSPTERVELMTLIRFLAQQLKISVMLIEHDVELVASTSDEMLALNFGAEMVRGSPDEVRTHPRVREAYLGSAVDTLEQLGGAE